MAIASIVSDVGLSGIGKKISKSYNVRSGSAYEQWSNLGYKKLYIGNPGAFGEPYPNDITVEVLDNWEPGSGTFRYLPDANYSDAFWGAQIPAHSSSIPLLGGLSSANGDSGTNAFNKIDVNPFESLVRWKFIHNFTTSGHCHMGGSLRMPGHFDPKQYELSGDWHTGYGLFIGVDNNIHLAQFGHNKDVPFISQILWNGSCSNGDIFEMRIKGRYLYLKINDYLAINEFDLGPRVGNGKHNGVCGFRIHFAGPALQNWYSSWNSSNILEGNPNIKCDRLKPANLNNTTKPNLFSGLFGGQ